MSEYVMVERPGERVATVTLNRPERRNALIGPLATELADTIEALNGDDTVSVDGRTVRWSELAARADALGATVAGAVFKSALPERASAPAARKNESAVSSSRREPRSRSTWAPGNAISEKRSSARWARRPGPLSWTLRWAIFRRTSEPSASSSPATR